MVNLAVDCDAPDLTKSSSATDKKSPLAYPVPASCICIPDTMPASDTVNVAVAPVPDPPVRATLV